MAFRKLESVPAGAGAEIRIGRDTETGEFAVRAYHGRVFRECATYYTDDLDDARATAAHMARYEMLSNTPR